MIEVYVTTNGCEEGQICSAYVEEFFRVNGSMIVRDSRQADLVIFYACGLTKEREIDSFRVIRKLKSEIKHSTRLIVWGCLPKIAPRSLAKFYDGPIVGPMDLGFFEEILGPVRIPFDHLSANRLVPIETFGIPRPSSLERFAGCILSLWNIPLRRVKKQLWESRYLGLQVYWIRVSTGCTGYCTYCADRCAWGRIRSRPINEVISEFEIGLEMGYNRFFLVSDDLGAYGVDIGSTLPDLLEKIVKSEAQRNYKIAMNQINPYHLKNLYHDLKDVFDSGRIGLLGCQVQSGSNRILKLMGRMYDAEDWLECMQSIRIRFPNIFLSTHFMVGFPTETDEDFKMTLRLLDKVLLDDVVIFKFSPRENVAASRLSGQIPYEVKEKRYKKLLLKATVNILTRKTQRLIWK